MRKRRFFSLSILTLLIAMVPAHHASGLSPTGPAPATVVPNAAPVATSGSTCWQKRVAS